MRATLVVVVVLAAGMLALTGCHPHHWPHHVRAPAPAVEVAGQ
ncbi:MAG: hypothetical protein R6V05_13525 [Candidatus Brocadiia bacterium]